jgi:uncharacterized 2Fe-2S/4Fe-4S cluster protein (DUF4445 family)
MPDLVRVRLQPLGTILEVERGAALQDVLFPYGVEFPCGGRGKCRGCRIRLLEGELPYAADEAEILTPEEKAGGWRIACRLRAGGDLTIEIAQWEAVILADYSSFSFTPSEGLGVAVDVGTTTLAAQLLDLATGHVLAVRTALNPQAKYGSDVMSRIQYALEGGRDRLRQLIRKRVGTMVTELLTAARREEAPVRDIVLVGNTVMHHLFAGLDVTPLSHYPFEPAEGGLVEPDVRELRWRVRGRPRVRFLPCLGSFVGSDILAGLLATGLHRGEEVAGLLDLGTNGEIVLGNRERMLCTSCAAGPAFEGGRISMGMRAATGAIAEVHPENGSGSQVRCHVLGGIEPRGICGSGLVDAVAAGLELGLIRPNGRLDDAPWVLLPPVGLTQRDIRELQLAKGAVAAGIRILLRHLGLEPGQVTRVYLAGAFGNAVSSASARRIGLIDFSETIVQPAGNTALLGAKMALFSGEAGFEEIRSRMRHISLASDPDFQDIYAEEMLFP